MTSRATEQAPARDVLWVSNETPDRHGQGGQRRQYFQIRALVDAGHRVHVMSLAGDQDDSSLSRIATVDRVRGHLMAGVRNPMAHHRLSRALRKGQFDAIVVSHIESWRWVGHTDPRHRPPTLVDLHNVYVGWHTQIGGSATDEREALRLLQHVLENTDGVSVCSGRELGRLPETPHASERIVAPHGVDPEEWPDRLGLGTSPEPYVALFGSWTWIPNLRGLEWFESTVWPAVVRQVPTARALVAGSGLGGRTSSAPGISYVGRVNDLAAFLGSAATAAIPVRSGVGASVKYAEALASGAPVIATEDAASAHPGFGRFVTDEPDVWIRHLVTHLTEPPAWPAPERDRALAELSWNAVSRPLDAWLRARPPRGRAA
ncbi:glycosyltransferase family 4 protein [Luteimicrobium sp. DT211]|uniref:glycosyltransferase family 4 protein n=1 Tax=Luteimicrobium sp. DT211 TaxID=3393412 RepID=UPI003CED7E69